MNIAEKVERKMLALEHLMNTQMHLELPSAVAESIEGLSKYWAHLSDEDKDYVDCASDALKNKRKWEV
jgi:hypothetical protein